MYKIIGNQPFAVSKCLEHSFKNYAKTNLSYFSLQSILLQRSKYVNEIKLRFIINYKISEHINDKISNDGGSLKCPY